MPLGYSWIGHLNLLRAMNLIIIRIDNIVCVILVDAVYSFEFN